MFSKRADGRRIKTLLPYYKIIPYIMKERVDAQVYFEDEISVDALDDYIKRKRDQGIKITHMDVVLAAIARAVIEKPRLNRFIMNRRIYARNEISISLALVKKLNEEDYVDTTVKFKVKPEDTIFTISEQVHKVVAENKQATQSNATDKLAAFIMSFPNWLIKCIINFVIFLDNHNLLPKAVIEASPFHTSIFLTNLGSIGIDSIYHHIYNFGTTSGFLAMGGRKERVKNYKTGETEKYMTFRFVMDERICDGYYYAKALSVFRRYILNPELLELPCEDVKPDQK